MIKVKEELSYFSFYVEVYPLQLWSRAIQDKPCHFSRIITIIHKKDSEKKSAGFLKK